MRETSPFTLGSNAGIDLSDPTTTNQAPFLQTLLLSFSEEFDAVVVADVLTMQLTASMQQCYVQPIEAKS